MESWVIYFIIAVVFFLGMFIGAMYGSSPQSNDSPTRIVFIPSDLPPDCTPRDLNELAYCFQNWKPGDMIDFQQCANGHPTVGGIHDGLCEDCQRRARKAIK